MEIKYKVVGGTSYHEGTPKEVINVLESYRKSRKTILIRWGDAETGQDWMEENDCVGRVGRSYGGTIHVPLLVEDGEIGGPAMLDHCIVRMIDWENGRVLYTHPQYYRPEVSVLHSDLKEYIAEGFHDGDCVARFRTSADAAQWLRIMLA